MTRDARLMALAFLLMGIGEGLLMFFHPLYLQQEFRASPVQIGEILGLAGGALALVLVPVGVLADRIGRKPLIVSSWILQTLAALMMFEAGSIAAFTVGLIIYNLANFAMAPTQSYIAVAHGRWPVARVLTTVSSFFGTGAIIGPALGSYIVGIVGLRTVYGVAVLFFVASTTLVLFIEPQPVAEPAHGHRRYGRILSNNALARLLVLAFLVSFSLFVYWPLVPNFLRGVRGVTMGEIGILGSFYSLGWVVLALTLGRMHPRLGFLLALGLAALSVVLLWHGSGMLPLVLGYFLAGVFRTVRPLVNTQVELLVHPEEIGLAFGLAETMGAIAVLLAAPLSGLLYSHGPDLPFPVSLGLMGVAAVLCIWCAPAGPIHTPGHPTAQ